MPKLANGLLCCGPCLFATAALVLAFFSFYGCYFVKLSDDNYLRKLDGFLGLLPEPDSLGFWCYQTSNGNWYQYPDFLNFSSKFDAARGMAVTTSIIGLIAWFFFLTAACVPFPRMIFVCMGFFLVLNCMFQGLTFLIFKAEECDPPDGVTGSCSLDTGAKCGIAATVLWFVAGLMTCAVSKDAAGDEEGFDEGQRELPKEKEQATPEADAEEGGAVDAGGED